MTGVCTTRPKWRKGNGGYYDKWDVTNEGMPILYVGYRQRLTGGHAGNYHCTCSRCRRDAKAESIRKEENAMAVSKNWDKMPPAGANNRTSRKHILQGQSPLRVIEKRDDEEELEAVQIVAPRNLGIKLLGALDGLIRKYQALHVPVKFGFEQDSGDVYLMTLKVETVPTQVLHQVEV